jgi:pyruvate formate lyase activating enzyme
MRDIGPTPPATLARAREIGCLAGLRYVYTGNVHDEEGGTTYCPECENAVIVRDWYEIRSYKLNDAGACAHCGAQLGGRYQAFTKPFGARRIPVRLMEKASG